MIRFANIRVLVLQHWSLVIIDKVWFVARLWFRDWWLVWLIVVAIVKCFRVDRVVLISSLLSVRMGTEILYRLLSTS